jgi:transposase
MIELCREFGISRKTAYKWVGRYNEDGAAAFEDRSRAPLSHPSRIAPVVLEALVQARRAHPHWGARKILAWLARKQPALALPVASTVSDVFARYGLSRLRHARRRTPPYTDPFGEDDAANRIWSADFKGDFKTGDYLPLLPTYDYRCVQPDAPTLQGAEVDQALSQSSSRCSASTACPNQCARIKGPRLQAAAPAACRGSPSGG